MTFDTVTASLTCRLAHRASRGEPDARIRVRSTLLPEEASAGSADPFTQARAILEDSDARCRATRNGSCERRRSEDTVWIGSEGGAGTGAGALPGV